MSQDFASRPLHMKALFRMPQLAEFIDKDNPVQKDIFQVPWIKPKITAGIAFNLFDVFLSQYLRRP
jgi:hypothetical protein